MGPRLRGRVVGPQGEAVVGAKVEIVIPRTPRISGEVVDDTGRGVEASVQAHCGSRPWEPVTLTGPRFMAFTNSGEDGAFELPACESGPNRIEVHTNEFEVWNREDVPAGATLEIVLERKDADAENDS